MNEMNPLIMELFMKNEILVQTITAILIAIIANTLVINTLFTFGILTLNDVVVINVVMTAISMGRSYTIRRFFANGNQTKKMSAVETCTNALIGLVTGYITYIAIVIPCCNNGIIECDNAVVITLIMTVVSMARTYAIRYTFKKTDKPT